MVIPTKNFKFCSHPIHKRILILSFTLRNHVAILFYDLIPFFFHEYLGDNCFTVSSSDVWFFAVGEVMSQYSLAK